MATQRPDPASGPAGAEGALILSGLLVLLFLGLAIAMPGEGFDADSLAFQLTMPGLDEEIFYRGVLLLILNEAFGRPVRVLGAQMGWGAMLTALAFALTHALGYQDGAFTFAWAPMATTGLAGLLLVWPVSSTHLTLPTDYSVFISLVAASIKQTTLYVIYFSHDSLV